MAKFLDAHPNRQAEMCTGYVPVQRLRRSGVARGRGRSLRGRDRRVLIVALATVMLASPAVQAASGGSAPARAATTAQVAAFPGPGWTTADPATSIVFRGAAPAQLRPFRVVGSSSGVHEGTLIRSRVGIGSVFTPARPFAPGERVTVRSGARVQGAASTTYAFTVAIPVHTSAVPPDPSDPSDGSTRASPHARAASSGVHDCTPHVWRFHTRPGLHPMASCVSKFASHTAPGLIFTTPIPTSHRQHGPTIYDQKGNVVWYHPLSYQKIFDLSVVTYRNERVLAFHVRYPRGSAGYRHASVLFYDKHYHLVARVTAHNGYEVDGHELQVRGDAAWIGIYHPIFDPVSQHEVYEYVVQKIDIRTGELLFEWHSLPVIPTAYSYYQPRAGQIWDYLHGNAIEPLADGGFLLSARNTSSLYRISRHGSVQWTMGGKNDDFHIVANHPDWQFCFQHDVRVLGRGRLSVFDNGGKGPGCPRHKARVEEFAYDPDTGAISRTAVFTSESASSDGRGYSVSALGSARYLVNGDLMVSWGTSGRITEFTPDHRVDFDLTLAERTYRAVRWRWVGDPQGRPSVAARRSGRRVTVWASWNGSTLVDRWRVFAGPSPSRMQPVTARVSRTGFETRISVSSRARYVTVRAIDARGRPLADARPITPAG